MAATVDWLWRVAGLSGSGGLASHALAERSLGTGPENTAAGAKATRAAQGWDPDHPLKVDRFTGVIYLAVGLVCLAIGLGGVALAGLAVYDRARGRPVPMEFVVLGGSLALFLIFGARGAWLGVRCFLPTGVSKTEIFPLYAEALKGEIVSRGTGGGLRTLLETVGGAALLGMFVLALSGRLLGEDDVGLALVAGGALLALLVGLAYFTLRKIKFGNSTCRLHTVPAFVGGELEAEVVVEFPRLRTGLPELPAGPVRVLLSHIGRSRTMAADWRYETQVEIEALQRPGDGTLRIPVRVAIPLEVRDRVDFGHWRLRLLAAYPGVDYASEFVVPVALPTGA